MPNKLIDIVGVSKSYGDNLVLDDLNLYIRENEFLTLLGPSGCGKTTLLRILGGFENPDSGKVIFDGKDITSLAPNKRQLNTVFQKYALFTHMTIAEKFIQIGAETLQNINQCGDRRRSKIPFQLGNESLRKLTPVCKFFLGKIFRDTELPYFLSDVHK